MTFLTRCSMLLLKIMLLYIIGVSSAPNVIVIQPDDMGFYNAWGSPPNNPQFPNNSNKFPSKWQHPNIEKLRTEGLWMKQAYTTSPLCATSRYSTLTGRYPARAAFSRSMATVTDEDVAYVKIPSTRLEDLNGLNDCSEDNLAAVLKASGLYRTGMFGKWHLSKIMKTRYTYSVAQATVKGCGFDHVDGLYIENVQKTPSSQGAFSHNMEWVTQTAIEFINNDTTWGDLPFFIYFNPTAPHYPFIGEALDISCRNTSNTDINPIKEPVVKGMTLEQGGCVDYRAYVRSRGTSDAELGAIWVDDAVGALYQALEDKGVLNNTIILFQLDHGVEAKAALYENGVRIAQFVHYPDGIVPGSVFDAPVSTIDVAPTILEFAGLVATYEMDGASWKDALANPATEEKWRTERCLFFEVDKDKAVRCGCYKYLNIHKNKYTSSSYNLGVKLDYSTNTSNLFDLCDGGTSYVTNKTNNMERMGANVAVWNSCKVISLGSLLQCYMDRVDYRRDPDYTPCKFFNSCTPSRVSVRTFITAAPQGLVFVHILSVLLLLYFVYFFLWIRRRNISVR